MPTRIEGRRPPPPFSHKLFFMLHPDHDAAERMWGVAAVARWRHGFVSPLTPKDRLHLSLNFVGAYAEPPSPTIAALAVAAASKALGRSFVVELNNTVSFRKREGARAFVARGDEGVIGVLGLHEKIHGALAEAGLAPRRLRPFEPHVTLAWDETVAPEEIIEPIRWRATNVALVHSPHGEGRHNVLARLPLAVD